MLRIGPGQDLRRPNFQRAIIAAVEHIDFPTHLREPGRRHVGAGILKSDKPPAAGSGLRTDVSGRNEPSRLSLNFLVTAAQRSIPARRRAEWIERVLLRLASQGRLKDFRPISLRDRHNLCIGSRCGRRW
jgi:hypothetical protein